MCVCVAHLVEVLIVECCAERSLVTDHLSSGTVLFIITVRLQCSKLRKGGAGGGGMERGE